MAGNDLRSSMGEIGQLLGLKSVAYKALFRFKMMMNQSGQGFLELSFSPEQKNLHLPNTDESRRINVSKK